MRTWVVGLSVATLVALTAQLALLAHFDGVGQAVAWAGVAAAYVADVLLLRRRVTRGTLAVVRWLAAYTVLVGAVGVLAHLVAALPDDVTLAALWATVHGPRPVLEPAAVALPGLLTLVATVGHPAAWRSPHDAATQEIPVVRLPLVAEVSR